MTKIQHVCVKKVSPGSERLNCGRGGMSGGPNHTDVDGEGARARSAGKGPLILAKLIVSYLDKKREVCWTHIETNKAFCDV